MHKQCRTFELHILFSLLKEAKGHVLKIQTSSSDVGASVDVVVVVVVFAKIKDVARRQCVD